MKSEVLEDFEFEEMKLSQNKEFLSKEFIKRIQRLLKLAKEKKKINFNDFAKKLEEAIAILEGKKIKPVD